MKKIFICIISTVILFACNNTKKENVASLSETDKSIFKAKSEYKTDAEKGLISSSNSNTEFNSTSNYNFSSNVTSTDAIDQASDKFEKDKPTPAPEHEKMKSNEPEKQPSKSYEDWDKKIIKTGDIVLEINNYRAYNNFIHKNVKAFGAYISQEEQVLSDDKSENRIVIKVPVENFDDLVNNIGGDSIKVIEKKITSQDVTTEVIDTKARIEAKKIVRLQYLELMRQAKNMKDILEVQTEINSVQEEIESAASRVNYLVHQSAYSTVNLKYYQILNGKKIEPEDSSSFSFKMKEAFRTGGNVISSLLVILLSIWPIIIIGALSLYLWKKRTPKKVNQS
ncbi:MAG: DUF4349 domain-containing protein [Chitinophagaceae bacterium]